MVTIPKLSELRASVQADLEASWGDQIPAFGKNFLRVISAVWAGKLWVQYKVLGFLQKNSAPDTADPESKGGSLERWGRIKMNRNPFTAIAGQYTVSITGTIGAVINAKTTFKSSDDSVSPGKMFIIDQEFTLLSSPDEITLRAIEPGVDSRLDNGDQVVSTIPIANVNKTGTVTGELVEPKAAEDTEEYRLKTLESFRTEPQGGAVSDYRIWSLDAQGVKQVYPFLAYGQENVIDVYVEAIIADSTDGKGTPSASLISDVEDVIDFDPDTSQELNERGRRPMNVIVNVLPIIPRNVAIIITGYVNLTPTIQTTIASALTELINEIRPFVDGIDVLADRNDRLDLNKIISKIYEAVPGSIFTSVSMTVNASPVSSYIFENGEIPYLNSVTYV